MKSSNYSRRLTLFVAVLGLALSLRTDEAGPRFLTSRTNAVALALPQEEPSFTFAVFGDRTGGPADGVEILAEAVSDVNVIGPDLVMTVGDLVQGYNTTEPWLEQMHEFKGIMNELDCEWFPVAGNHDTYWRGKDRPTTEHDANFEEHFGPLWYAFRHKTAWFFVLYTDEGDSKTGRKDFHKPAAQRISADQYAWLDDTLKRATEAEHVFVFMHHPRWKGGQYGGDWQRVHTRLVEAGNVSAVFAGHIHAMTYDGVQDGIEYFTLATVGGFVEGGVPEAGYLHQFDLVTVRKDGIDVASIPVGEVTDPRTITSELALASKRVHDRLVPKFKGVLTPCEDLTSPQELTVSLKNPVETRLAVTLSVAEGDLRRPVRPDHMHFLLEGGQKLDAAFEFYRNLDAVIDGAFRLPELVVSADYLGQDVRISIPERRFPFPASTAGLLQPPRARVERVVMLDSEEGSYLAVPSASFELPNGAFTIEGWARFDDFAARQGFIAKTENSDYALFTGEGKPAFFVHLDGRYNSVEGAQGSLPKNEWVHLAGVFDGRELRLYVGGQLVARAPGSGKRKRNELPLILGGDVNGEGLGVSLHRGGLDEVRVSRVARYASESFEPLRRFESDSETALLFHMDAASGPWVFDSSDSKAHAVLRGAARVE